MSPKPPLSSSQVQVLSFVSLFSLSVLLLVIFHYLSMRDERGMRDNSHTVISHTFSTAVILPDLTQKHAPLSPAFPSIYARPLSPSLCEQDRSGEQKNKKMHKFVLSDRSKTTGKPVYLYVVIESTMNFERGFANETSRSKICIIRVRGNVQTASNVKQLQTKSDQITSPSSLFSCNSSPPFLTSRPTWLYHRPSDFFFRRGRDENKKR